MRESSTRFAASWHETIYADGSTVYQPVLRTIVRGRDGPVDQEFLIDNGADVSMAPLDLFGKLGLRWRAGLRFPVQGISRRRNCALVGRLHEIDLLIPAAGILMRIPVVFVRGDAPYVLGRDALFETFTITFDPLRRRTVFDLLDR